MPKVTTDQIPWVLAFKERADGSLVALQDGDSLGGGGGGSGGTVTLENPLLAQREDIAATNARLDTLATAVAALLKPTDTVTTVTPDSTFLSATAVIATGTETTLPFLGSGGNTPAGATIARVTVDGTATTSVQIALGNTTGAAIYGPGEGRTFSGAAELAAIKVKAVTSNTGLRIEWSK